MCPANLVGLLLVVLEIEKSITISELSKSFSPDSSTIMFMKRTALLFAALIWLQAFAMASYATTVSVDEIMAYTSPLLEANGFPGAYSDHNVLADGIAKGQTVLNAEGAKSLRIGETLIPFNASMNILYNTSSENPTQADVDKIGETLWNIATQVREHFNNEIDVSIRVNPGNLGPFGNNKPHFNEFVVKDGLPKISYSSD